MSVPLISVITPTWLRSGTAGKLQRCLDSVAAQKYQRWEHVVVSDGPDPEFQAMQSRWQDRRRVFACIDSHDPRVRWGVRARLAGIELAQGDIFAWLDDDNAFLPHHLDSLYWRLHLDDAAWAFSQALFQREGESGGYPVGGMPCTYGNMDTSTMMSTRRVHEVLTWRDVGQPTIDWDLAERWMAAGYQPAFLPEITVNYYIQFLGGPRMAKWSLHAAGEVAGEKLHDAAAEIAEVLHKHGLATSQFTSDAHNGPLPEPAPAPPKARGKAPDATS